MFIVWGTRRKERFLGHVADCCPICREVRPFRVIRVGLASHIYYISFGAGKLAGHEMQCGDCGVQVLTDASRYASMEKKLPAHLSELTQVTFPNLHTVYASELAQLDAMRRAPRALSPEQRALFLMEPLRILMPSVENRYARGTEMDKPAGIGCLATTVLFIGILAGAMYLQNALSDNVLLALAIVAGVGGLYTFIQLGLAPGRYLRARTIPQLARALAPLQPEENELKECLKRCRDIGWKIGSKIKPRQILAEIERRREAVGQVV